MNPFWLLIAQEFKFYSHIDKMVRDPNRYIHFSLLCLIESVIEIQNRIMEMIKEDFTNFINLDIPELSVVEEVYMNSVLKI